MTAADSSEFARLYREQQRINRELVEARAKLPPIPVDQPYAFTKPDGERVTLEELFGAHENLIVVHNMGRRCSYCTMWADGLIGMARHIRARSALVLVSPDPPEDVGAFAAERGWTFDCVSDRGSAFSLDMGFATEDRSRQPGASAFHKDERGNIARVSTVPFGPGDLFCPAWHFFDMLPGGAKEFAPA